MSEEETVEQPSKLRWVVNDIKQDFSNIKEKLSGHARKAEMTE